VPDSPQAEPEEKASTGSSQNQTLSFLSRRLREVGIQPRTGLGQNFLIDLNLVRLLVAAAELGPDDVVLEVGTGTGSLTGMMAPLVASVVTVEVDRQMHQLASEELFNHSNITLLHTDALEGKNRLSCLLLDTVHQKLAEAPGRRFKLVANLPYNIATPLISNLLDLDRPPDSMHVTIQKEVADRLLARPSTKDYGALSIWVQSQCRAELVRVLGPTVFWPRPKVHSAIVRIVFDPARRAQLTDRRAFHDFVRSMFLHRRKLLRSELIVALKGKLDKPQVDALMAEVNLGPETRAEQLDVAAMLALSDAVRRRTTVD